MSDYLFSDADVYSVIELMQRDLGDAISAENPDYVLSVSEVDLVAHYVDRFRLDPPEIHRDAIHIHGQSEVEVDVSGDSRRYFSTPGPHYMKGTQIVIAVPYSGDRRLFRFQPNQYTHSPPRASVREGELHLVYAATDLTSDDVRQRYETDVSTIEQWLGWMRAQVEPYNAALEGNVKRLIEQRKEKVMADRNVVANIGLPIRQRPGEAKTYTVPDVRRKATVTPRPQPTGKPFVPEPALEQATFEEILQIIRAMAHVIERSPTAFRSMGEEDLRQHFLVQLNGQFEGDASGETFNFDGKTDILIRRDDRNVFIAECKFWSGPKTVMATLDQILGYLSWRDTKAAVLLFVRNKNFSDVVQQIVQLVEAHPNHKKTLAHVSETEFQFTFGQRDDENRELTLAVLLFAVPA